MAITNPTLTCTTVTGQSNTGLKCQRPVDSDGNITFTCSRWRFFYPNCPKGFSTCQAGAGAWVAAITCCAQRLF
jgi:hypothetical protein